MKKCQFIRKILPLILFAFFYCSAALAESITQDDIDQTKTAIEQWVETQRVISKEKQDLMLSKQILNERIDLIQREIDSLNDKISQTQKSIDETEKKKAELLLENDKLKEASELLVQTVKPIETKVGNLISKLPDPIRDRIKPLSQRLPEDSNSTKQSVSERFQNVVGILNEIDKFNREISASSEVRNLDDGTAIEVTAVYIGIGQGFYVSANGSVSGIGTVEDNKWIWKPDNQSAVNISDALAILKNEKIASFVQVPLEVK